MYLSAYVFLSPQAELRKAVFDTILEQHAQSGSNSVHHGAGSVGKEVLQNGATSLRNPKLEGIRNSVEGMFEPAVFEGI